jgi:hypothetical protein
MAKRPRSGGGTGIGVWLGVGAVAAVLIAGLVLTLTDRPPGTKLPNQGWDHIPSYDTPHPPYNSNPPTSGWHVAQRPWFRIYDQMLPNELQVHGLEDGAVIIHYHPEKVSQEEVDRLAALLRQRLPGRNPNAPLDELDHLIIHPNSTIETAWALTAWTRLDAFDKYDERRIMRFALAYKGIDNHPRR